MKGADLADAAVRLIGTRFRLHGRDPVGGLDCIGVLGAAMAEIGRPLVLPTGYPLRLARTEAWLPDPAACGFTAAAEPFLPGDVILLRPGPAQVHLAIAAPDGGWIHAHAGLRQVVHQATPPAGLIIHHWRLRPPS